MEAIVCNEFGPVENLSIQELPDPAPNAGEVLIRVNAVGVNFPDALWFTAGTRSSPRFPSRQGSNVLARLPPWERALKDFQWATALPP